MSSILIIFAYSFILPFTDYAQPVTTDPVGDELTIQIQNAEELEFEFSITYQEIRNQIHVRSDEAIRSLRLMNEDKKKNAYNAIGSNLVILPLTDFSAGQRHILEIKFNNIQLVVLAEIFVPSEQ